MGAGKNIRSIRLLKGMKQETIAEKSGVSSRWLSKLENEQEQLTEDLLVQIAQALEVTPYEIEYFHEKPIFNQCPNSINSGITSNSTINYNDIEKVTTLYEQLLAEKERTILILLKKLGK
jgi:transcriptional regulator with XRE-family HTH domain